MINASLYTSKITSEIKIFQNLPIIYQKVEQEGSINLITKTFDQIFEKESIFAISGKLKRIEKIP